jgi:hypothetical protein
MPVCSNREKRYVAGVPRPRATDEPDFWECLC